MTETAPALAGVVGWPISHSLSPRLHGHWLTRYGIAGHYIPIGLRPQDFETGFRALPKLGFRGVNLTIPYKEAVLAMATSVSDRASLIGAANTIVFREGGGVVADNTDAYGFLESVRQAQPGWSAKGAGAALILGAGGASRAIVHALLADGIGEVRLANRTRQRSNILKDQFGARMSVVDWNLAADAIEGAGIIVNTTALGMPGKPELTLPLDTAAPGTLVVDIVYGPTATGFLREAARHGLPTIDGLGMLLHQAVPGFESWFGQRPEVDAALRRAVLA